ncbi:uncharacterized protein LOC125049113 [Pieris napi]|uniref:uncharacterized protein LOC125049113 n=1 Tax=Pieris napi TaxID=78633 RepID=UPI001FB9BC0F|nr:uncharacterized protein LOC125049113 [Pieris napi]
MTALHNVTEHINLLATAIVVIKGNYGHTTVLRALIDSGSQSCFITQKATQALKLQRKPVNLVVTGMDNMKVNIKQEVNFDLLSRWEPNFELPIHAYVMSQPLKFNIPSSEYLQQELRHFEKLNLADPNFMDSGALDLLLGVQEYTAILKQGLIKGPSGTICAQKTSLGWIVMGGININMKPKHKAIMAMNITTDASFNDLIKTIWEIDTDTKRNLTKEELRCEEFYKETHARNNEGRYIVRLPFKTEAPLSSEGNTKETAIKRLMQLERRFSRNPELKDEYLKVINEYKTLNHIEEVPEKELHKKSVYLPHHAVVRQDKETTKTRVVFDASCKGSNNISLNEELLSGPVLQEDLRNLIMRWRIHAICFVSDIQMMYRMIKIHRDDVDYQRIVWRENPSDEIRDYRLLTVTFGTASAPYLAVKTLKQLAIDEGDNFPEAARILNEDFYVDDCMSGSDDVQKAIQISKDLKELLRRGGFELKKWSSNNTEFMQSLKPDERTTKAHFDLKLDGIIKALGVQWNLGNDRFEYNLNLPEIVEENIITKRNILSDIQKLFDPLGWIAPSIVQAKILIQKLWLEKVDWDEDLNIFLKEEWLKIRRDLMNVNNISIDRWLSTSCSNMDTIQIHGYCDASILAYAAVVYCLVKKTDGSYRTSLIAARTRVAPLKTISLPKLELSGALLLSRLLNQVAQAMRIPMERVFAWTDSSIVIAWLSGEPTKWKPFVANRVVEILANHKKEQWHHVQSQENPADIASRGMFISDLKHCNLWWKGPTWLQKGEIILTDENIFTTDLEKKKEKIKTLILTNIKEVKRFSEKFERFTTLNELLRTIAYCKKFIKFKKDNKNITITTEDIEEALLTCIKIVQNEEFETEIDSLKKKNNIKKNSKLKTLNPFLDNNGVLRVGGRLAKSSLETNTKHPIIIGNNNTLVSLIIADAHKRTLHGGIQLMLCYLRSKYWVLRAKDMTKKHIHRCLICAKESAKVKTQLMGDLPSVRTTPSRPFINAGVDFAGPFQIVMNKGRGIKTNKAYAAIFVCMSTKAMHLELVGDMTSNSFIAAYRRFTSRRGKCAHLWSDQGKNFVGANKELYKAWEEAKLQFDQEIIDSLANDGTQWHFIPAYSPNFGGLWMV